MKKIKLNDGNMMPLFGLGTFLITDEQEAYNTIKQALLIGYRLIDTAQMYGNEKSIGRAIIDSQIPREEIFITTKLKHQSISKDEIRTMINESLKDLNTPYIDLFLIHWPSPVYQQNSLTWEVLEEYVNNGLIKSIGVSNFAQHHITELLKTAKILPTINQVEMHPGLSQMPLQEFLKKLDIQLCSYGPFMKGLIFQDPYIKPLQEIATNHFATIAQVVISWGLQKNIVMIPKSVHAERLLENFQAQELLLSQEELEKINTFNRGSRVYTDPDNNVWYKKR